MITGNESHPSLLESMVGFFATAGDHHDWPRLLKL